MRRFEFVEGSSSKFWSPELQGNTFIVTYGRIGTAGQRKEKAFPDEESARREYEKKVAEKLREGYREVTDGGEAPAPAAREEKAPPPRPELPPRLRPGKPTAEQVAAAARALSALEAWAEPELALRLGLLLTERPELRGGSEVGWQRRWNALKPHLEAHLRPGGGALQTHLRALDTGGDVHLAQRVARMVEAPPS